MGNPPNPQFERPKQGWRFAFGGVNLKDPPDALSPTKYASAQNVRGIAATAIRTRPGYVPGFTCGNAAITDIHSYATIETDDAPRFLARDTLSRIYLDTGNLVTTLASPPGPGVSMIPFRPSQSPQTWMYVGGQNDYQKISAPNANNNATVFKVGIAEPQIQLEAAPMPMGYLAAFGANWGTGGTASGLTNGNRVVDTVQSVTPDPAISTRQTVGVSNNVGYQVGMVLFFGGYNNAPNVVVQDVCPAIPQNLTIQSIYYLNGNNGNCVIVPTQFAYSTPPEPNQTATLRRGSIVNISGGNNNEIAFVQSVVTGPQGALEITTSTNNSWTSAAVLSGLPAIVIDGYTPTISQSILSNFEGANLTAGSGTLTLTFGSINPFAESFGSNNSFPQLDDYFHISVAASNPTVLNSLQLLFNLDGNNYTGSMMQYMVLPGTMVNVAGNTQTQIQALYSGAADSLISNIGAPGIASGPGFTATGNNQWSELWIPLSSMTLLGGDPTKTLATCNGIQLVWNVTGNMSVMAGSVWVGGGSQPDVGNNGASYQYQAVPGSSLTGVQGNPTSVMRYGVRPRRQAVLLTLPATGYDPQIDTWFIYRYGGSITSYRFLGTVASNANNTVQFTDDYFDDPTGNPLVTDNTEPWPSIDVPWTATANNSTIQSYGTWLTVAAALFPNTIGRWLPGTLLNIGAGNAYTLRSRPLSSNNGAVWTFETEECAGYNNSIPSLTVYEPNVARQTLPYLWGPDAEGTIFGVGDPLRPGTISFTKSNTPDSVPTAYNIELCPPSEPLMGGALIKGLSYVASTARWWALYPSFNSPNRYTQIEQPVGRPLVAPFGICTDSENIYFWSRDCIALTAGAGFKSLTDEDLYPLFPHGGTTGKNVVRSGVTYYAPDYSRVASFRLEFRGRFLFATYQDSTGTPRVMVLDISTGAWNQDVYTDPVTVFGRTDQQAGTISSNNNALYASLMIGDANGKVWKVQDGTGDNNSIIVSKIATFEFVGDDLRAGQLWGDQFLDYFSQIGITAQPVYLGNNVGNATILPGGNNRQMLPISLGGGQLLNFLGLSLTWGDYYNNATTSPTMINAWQPSYIDKPETITDRAGDWMIFGSARYVQGVIIHADTFGANKSISIHNADTGALIQFSGGPALGQINHNGEQQIAYSFPIPFISHMIRDEPQDMVPWRRFSMEFITQPTPELAQYWTTQWTGLGIKGYKHIPRIEPMYSATATVTLTITSFDGTSPAVITLPSTGGNPQRSLITLTLNKGQLYKFSATSGANFQIFDDDFLIWVGEWGRPDSMIAIKNLGSQYGDKAPI